MRLLHLVRATFGPRAGADHADRDRLRRQVEAGVHRTQGARASALAIATEMLRSEAPWAIGAR
jgi:hypothetical protein